MSMTSAQAKQLGGLIAQARTRKGLTVRALGAEIGVAIGWIARLEAGHYADPAPDRLAQLAEVLGIEPSRIDRIAKGAVTDGLPEPRVYFRAKLDLTAEQADRVERYIDRMRRAA